jgi:hypothetical protein
MFNPAFRGNMSSLERAKRFLAEKTSRLALSVVPLAALAVSAVPAHAEVTFNVGSGSGNGNCSVSASFMGSGSCSSFQQSATGGNVFANWVAIQGNGSMSSASGGSIDFAVNSGGASGVLASGTIPISWDFLLDSSSSGSVAWSVLFRVSFSGGGSDSFSMSGSTSLTGLSSVEVVGSGAITIGTGGSVDGYAIALDTNTFGTGIPYSVDIPDGSLDLNSPAPAPEPATLFLVPAAGALLFLRRKKRNR